VSTPAARRPPPLDGWIRLWIFAAVAFRLGYHAQYFGEVPFTLATFSDGALYEKMAADILAHPPWGSEPFYLQGVYGALMACAMAIRDQPSTVLFAQLLIAAVAWWGLFRALGLMVDRRTAGVATAIALSYPAFSFYENKHLTATLAVASLIAMLAGAASMIRRGSWRGAGGLGLATGLAILARSNTLLCVPFAAWAVVLAARAHRRPAGRWVAIFGGGLLLALAPMALRNAVVTSQATVMPAHGGGTSFYIGNNREARGVWNDAGGLLSGDVSHERTELARRLGVDEPDEAQRVKKIGRALYARAWSEIAESPGRWAWLEVRKVWLLAGNDELTQDYDRLGERELVGAVWYVGLPFGLLLGLWAAAWVGARGRERTLADRAWIWVCIGQAVAVLVANLGFFTSSQHRLPLVIPMLAYAAWARPDLAWREGDRRRRGIMVAVALLLTAQGLLPRSKQTQPSAVHYFNLAIAQKRTGDPRAALVSLSRAVEQRPDHVVIRVERATLARELGEYELTRQDVLVLSQVDDLPLWVRERRERERQWLVGVGVLAPQP
jgi:4-amino-4-deoxy-L-arabinose transferase-like glycosyltransferase